MMRAISRVASPLLLLGAFAPAGASVVASVGAEGGDRTITQVVKLLQSLLDKSKVDADTDRELYGKYKCYCDSTKKEKEAEIVDTDLLMSQVEELKAANGKLSREVAKLDADMKENEASRTQAEEIRKKENDAYLLLKADLEGAIPQMEQAIQVLADIGADQTLATAADHKQYMADFKGANLASLKTTVKEALMAASAFVSKKQLSKVDAFLQAPFTGAYTSQAGEVVGILKEMRDTFKANLEEATATEAKQLAAHEKLMETMLASYQTMSDEYSTKQGMLGDNDSILSQKKMQLENLIAQIEAARAFLEKLATMCSEKKAEYDHRVTLRMDEQAALSEAIAILNSDEAFETFGNVDATKTGATAFLQRAAVRRHRTRRAPTDRKVTAAASERRATEFLQKLSGSESSPLFSRVYALLQAGNPFATVLTEIDKMIALIAKEGKADLEQKETCVEERTTTNTAITEKENAITTLDGAIQDLDAAINDPKTGLKAAIKQDEESVQENFKSQGEETQARKADNVRYQQEISGLVSAQALLERAVTVLKKYYEKKIHEIQAGLVQVHHKKQDPAPPATWTDTKYEGQSAGGNSAVGMLEFILKNTAKEENVAHDDELKAQTAYEDSMQGLKDEEEQLQDSLAKNHKELSVKEEELLSKKKDLKKTQEELAALQEYLLKIKPGCDYIMANIDKRDQHRATEKQSLETAVTKIKATPAYQDAMAAAHTESLGDCADVCKAQGEDHVECKACLAKVTVPGYCAGHAGTVGC